MGYKNLRECILDLEQNGHLVRINEEVDARLEVGAIQRRVYQAGGPAVFFSRVKGCQFPLVGNLFGTLERTRFMFRDSLKSMERLVAAKIDLGALLRDPASLAHLPFDLLRLWPRKIHHGPILAHETSISQLPQIQSWPDDGGAFITLPLVYSESPSRSGCAMPTWECTGFSFPVVVMPQIRRLAFITSCTGGLVSTMLRPWRRMSLCG